jgi:hypothetical protein
MALKIELFSNQLGPHTVEPDSIDLDKLDQTLERSKSQGDGVVYEYSLDLRFTKETKDYLYRAFKLTGGIEALVTAQIYEHDPNAFKWELIGTGKIKFTNYDRGQEDVKTSIEQTGFERKVINLADIDVDVETELSQGKVPLIATPTIELELHPKKIIKQTNVSPADGLEFAQLDAFEFEFQDDGDLEKRMALVYGQIDNGNQKLKELEESFTLPYGYTLMDDIPLYLSLSTYAKGVSVRGITGTIYTSLIDSNEEDLANAAAWAPGLDKYLEHNTQALAKRNEVYRAAEAGVLNGTIKIRAKHDVFARNDGGDVDIAGSGCMGELTIKAWLEHRRVDNTFVSVTQIGSDWSTPGVGGDSRGSVFETKELPVSGVAVEIGDKFYVYHTLMVAGEYQQPNEGSAGHGHVWHEFRITCDPEETVIQLVNETEFPATTAKAGMIYEVLNKLAEYYTDIPASFVSDFFGRTDSQPVAYAADGPGSLLAITNGRAVRQMENQRIFTSLLDIFNSLRAVHCLGMGIETIAGKQVVRIEPLEHFYNKNLLILELGVVSKFRSKVSTKHYYNQIEVGFNKLDIQTTNGIDEFTTLRKFKNAITQITAKLPIVSKFKASGFEIESQRRLIGTTKDSKLDDANFFVNVRRDGLGGFVTDKAQDYPLVENLYDSGSAYNLDFAPTRMLKAWGKVLAACVINITNKVLTFSSGEGNYAMNSQRNDELLPQGEDDDIDLTNVEPLWDCEIYSFEVPLTRDQMRQIRANPYGYFKFKEIEGGPDLEGYLLKVKRDSGKKLGDFDLLKVYRKTDA